MSRRGKRIAIVEERQPEYLAVQLRLVAVVIVNGGQIDLRTLAYLARGCRVVADLGKHLGRGLQQAPARLFLGARLMPKQALRRLQQQAAGFFFSDHVLLQKSYE